MKRTSRLLTLAAAIALSGLAATQAAAATGTASSSVTIRKPISVTKTADMNFGEILPPTTGSQTFVLAPATGTITPGSGDGLVYGTPVAAAFTVVGSSNKTISVSTSVTTNFTSGVSLASLTTSGNTTSIPPGGNGAIAVGGTLSVDSTAVDGDRTAAILLTVNYQ